MRFLISLLAPDGTIEYPDTNGDPTTGKGYHNPLTTRVQAVPFVGNEGEAGSEAHRRAELWSKKQDCLVRGLKIEPLGA